MICSKFVSSKEKILLNLIISGLVPKIVIIFILHEKVILVKFKRISYGTMKFSINSVD